MQTEREVRELIANSCSSLDENDYEAYLELCSPDFTYRITTYSPEIRKEMIWLEKDKAGMSDLIGLLPKQNMDHTPLTRHFNLCTIKESAEDQQVQTVSTFQIFRTEHDGGATSLVAIGKYIDTICLSSNGPALLNREVRLQTRSLGKGYHVPF